MQNMELYKENADVFSPNCEGVDLKIKKKKDEMLKEWKDIPNATN